MTLPPAPRVNAPAPVPPGDPGRTCAVCGGPLTDQGLAGFRTVDPSTGGERLLAARVLACPRCGTLRLVSG